MAAKTQDDKYEDTFFHKETVCSSAWLFCSLLIMMQVDIMRYKVDELVVTPSRSNVTIKSANYVVGEDVAVSDEHFGLNSSRNS